MRKRVVEEPLCPICNLEAKTMFHVLQDYPASRDVWGVSQRMFQKSTFSRSDFFQVVGALLEMGGGDIFSLFLEISRRIWLRRNVWIYDGQFSHLDHIVREAKMVMMDYEQETRAEEHKGRNLLERQTLLVKPACGWIKVNVDAVLDKGARKMGFGLIMHDHEGKFLAAKSIT